MSDVTLKAQIHPSIGAIAASQWDACAGPDNPFLSHAFLSAMEESGTACQRTGWMPSYLTLGDGDPVAAVPLYVKSHSEGEFIFDYGWASAYQRAGGHYYPKLQVAVPYTPVPGPRLLIRPGFERLAPLLRTVLAGLCRELDCSSLHVTFCQEEEFQQFEPPWLKRTGLQFHWHNRGYASFDDFLGTLASRKRKAVRKERLTARSQGLVLEAITGSDLSSRHWDAFYSFYLDTSGRKWGRAALTRDFFDRLGQTMADRVVLMLAREGQTYCAGALNLLGSQALYGRNWGCLGYYPCLHFELCYYMAIDFAIERKLARVEAGAQGMHKVARGYEPTLTYSAHYVRDAGFREVLARHLQEERHEVELERDLILERTPFRRLVDQE